MKNTCGSSMPSTGQYKVIYLRVELYKIGENLCLQELI